MILAGCRKSKSDSRLGANDVDTLIMLGYATSGVILSTTRFAADAD
jgi:hypothetical protein